MDQQRAPRAPKVEEDAGRRALGSRGEDRAESMVATTAAIGELFREERRHLERARVQAEEQLAEYAHGLGAEIEAKLSRRLRRQELKLARQERDRKLRAAERRVQQRSEQAIEVISSQAAEIEDRLRAARVDADRGTAVIVDTAALLQERIQGLLDTEARFTTLLDQIAASEQRIQAAHQRVVLAEWRALSLERAVAH